MVAAKRKLILVRKPDQGLLIDGPARIVVVSVEGVRVKLLIEADRDVLVLREELR